VQTAQNTQEPRMMANVEQTNVAKMKLPRETEHARRAKPIPDYSENGAGTPCLGG
jgi:hypothetical protein